LQASKITPLRLPFHRWHHFLKAVRLSVRDMARNWLQDCENHTDCQSTTRKMRQAVKLRIHEKRQIWRIRQQHGYSHGYRSSDPYPSRGVPVPVNPRVYPSKRVQKQPNRPKNEWDMSNFANQLQLTQFWSRNYLLGLVLKVMGRAIVTRTRTRRYPYLWPVRDTPTHAVPYGGLCREWLGWAWWPGFCWETGWDGDEG
jgi:hypothetical protein